MRSSAFCYGSLIVSLVLIYLVYHLFTTGEMIWGLLSAAALMLNLLIFFMIVGMSFGNPRTKTLSIEEK